MKVIFHWNKRPKKNQTFIDMSSPWKLIVHWNKRPKKNQTFIDMSSPWKLIVHWNKRPKKNQTFMLVSVVLPNEIKYEFACVKITILRTDSFQGCL